MASPLDLLKLPSLVRRAGEAASKSKPFYSAVDRAISEITQGKGSGEQFLGMILNKKGVKPQEIKDRGLDKLLTGKMTKADVQRIAAENPPPQIQQSTLRGAVKPGNEYWDEYNPDTDEYEIFDSFGRLVKRAEDDVESRSIVNSLNKGEAEFSEYTIPKGENYREIKFKLPLGKEKIARDARFREIADELVNATPEQFAALHAERSKLYNEHINNRAFLSSHYKEPKLLAHARVSDRTGPNGEKILHIEEIQSDWHQKARELRKQKIKELIRGGASEEDATKAVPVDYGYQPADQDSQINALISKREAETSVPERMKMMEEIQSLQRIQESGVPDAPFKTNWHELVIKRLLDDASRNGYDRVLITPGAEQAKRYPDPNKTPEELLRGFAGFYDEKLPLYLNKYGEKYGASVQPHSFTMEGSETPLHAFDINPQMRGEIVEKGQSLYQMAPPAIGAVMQEPEEKKDGGEIKASPIYPGQDSIGRIGQVAEKLGISLQEAMGILAKEGNSPIKAFLGNLLLADPLKSAGTALQDYTGTPRDITPESPYSRLLSGKGMTMRLDPRVLDVAGFAAPVASRAKAVAKGLPDAIKDAAVAAYGPGATASYVIKQKGGNWLQGSVENAMRGLKKAENLDDTEIAKSINQFIDKQLTRYVKNDMGTPDDPVKLLADRGISHVQGNPTLFDLFQANYNPDALAARRVSAGFPGAGSAKTQAGIGYEGLTDSMIGSQSAGRYVNEPQFQVYGAFPAGAATREAAQSHIDSVAKLAESSPRIAENLKKFPMSIIETGKVSDNPWLNKLESNTPVYQLGYQHELGFDHLIDELRNATNPESGLPRNLLLKPESLSKLSVPQAVERVAKINEWRASQKAEADLARARNPATVLHKEYPEGYSWQELKLPENMELPEGYKVVKYEYPGKPTFFSVTDPKGITQHEGKASEVAALKAYAESKGHPALEDSLKYEGEQMGHCVGGYCPDVASGKSRIFSLRDAKGQPHVTIETKPPEMVGGMSVEDFLAGPQRIVQIKGKSNLAPNEEYLPYVQDFVRSGKWSDVGDLRNAGLLPFKGGYTTKKELEELVKPAQEWYLNSPYHNTYKSMNDADYRGDHYRQLDDWSAKMDVPVGNQRYSLSDIYGVLTDPAAFDASTVSSAIDAVDWLKANNPEIPAHLIPKDSGMKRGGPVNQDAMNMAVWGKGKQNKQYKTMNQDAMNIAVLNKRLKGKRCLRCR